MLFQAFIKPTIYLLTYLLPINLFIKPVWI